MPTTAFVGVPVSITASVAWKSAGCGPVKFWFWANGSTIGQGTGALSKIISAVFSAAGTFTITVRAMCSYGDSNVEYESDPLEIIVPIKIALTFDDGPTSAASNNNTLDVINTLENNAVQSPIDSTFFVQTHVSNRGGHPGGISNMETALSKGHEIHIHTGSDIDHTRHTIRVSQPPYDANGDSIVNSLDGDNALEGDLIRAKVRIDNLQGGSTPTMVRPPHGDWNQAVLSTYADQGLTMKLWDLDSKDSLTGATTTTINTALSTGTPSAVAASVANGSLTIVVLFHDVKSVTADNLALYMQTIKNAVAASGNFVAVFDQL
jgi:peptidoglycan/xylan/chitin deacetylase (PgdA/CDA1 family)